MELSTPTGCAIYLKDREVCSDKHVVNHLSQLLDELKLVKHTPKSDKEVVEILKKETKCNDEACVLESSLVQNSASEKTKQIIDKNLRENFPIVGPANSTKWLSNFNIDDVLDQIEKKHPGFLHINFQMIDFAEVDNPEGLHRINLAKKYRNGMKQFGVVINTDKSTGPGQHWFCLFGDFTSEPITLEYFNSSGDPPMSQISIWLEKTRNELEMSLGKQVKIIKHNLVHQNDDHSCGPYSLYYIISRISGVPAKIFSEKIIPDERMVEFRKHLFRDENGS